MSIDHSLFLDVADALGMGNPAIVEKDYQVVHLLKLLSVLSLESHSIVFSGGTALSKSGIKIHRMSEDVDIKIVPKNHFFTLSKAAKRKIRKSVHLQILNSINSSISFVVETTPIIFDEYRYQLFNIRYPQCYSILPCLRPFIKLELIETLLHREIVELPISSLVNEVMHEAPEIKKMNFTSITNTQAEKMVSMLRRTAAFARNKQRSDDPALIRHIYDIYYIQQENIVDLKNVMLLVKQVIIEDVSRYGNQHEEFAKNPIDELLFGLFVIENNNIFEERFNQYVLPMVYGDSFITWEQAFIVFKSFSEVILKELATEF